MTSSIASHLSRDFANGCLLILLLWPSTCLSAPIPGSDELVDIEGLDEASQNGEELKQDFIASGPEETEEKDKFSLSTMYASNEKEKDHEKHDDEKPNVSSETERTTTKAHKSKPKTTTSHDDWDAFTTRAPPRDNSKYKVKHVKDNGQVEYWDTRFTFSPDTMTKMSAPNIGDIIAAAIGKR